MRNLGLMDPAFVGGLGERLLWTPAQISTALWLDAADASTITLNGSTVSVSQWNDKSSNSRHVSQVSASAQPLYSTNQISGKPAIAFDGGSDFLRTTSSFQLGPQFSVFGVVKPEAGNGWNDSDYRYLFNHDTSLNSLQGAACIIGSQIFADWVAGDTIAFGNGFNSGRMPRAIGPVPTGTDARVLSLSLGNTESFFAINSTIRSTRVSGTGTRQDVNAPLTVGANSNGGQWLLGDIGEFLIVSGTVSLLGRQQVEGYLAHKWGLTANLPNDHPYKVNPPYV